MAGPTPRSRGGIRVVRQYRSAFTLIEMLTTVAALVIVLGLMVSLARDVRSRSADRLTKDLLGRLDRLMSQYQLTHAGELPSIARLIEGSNSVDEVALHQRAIENNRQFVFALTHQEELNKSDLEDLPLTNSARTSADRSNAREDRDADAMILDAWGGPVVFMARQQPSIGMAPADRFFFFSPGPDGRFLTRQDNLYSYDASVELPRVAATRPTEPKR